MRNMTKFLLCTLLVGALGFVGTPLQALEIGKKAPDFSAKTYDGKDVSLADLSGKVVVFEWFNPHCPFVRKHYRNGDMQALQSKYAAEGVQWIMVNSTAQSHKDYFDQAGIEKWLGEHNVTGPLFVNDSSGELGRAFGAKATPHMFVVDSQGIVRYHGAIDDDDSASGDPKTANNYVANALTGVIKSQPIEVASTDAYGCSVKYAS